MADDHELLELIIMIVDHNELIEVDHHESYNNELIIMC